MIEVEVKIKIKDPEKLEDNIKKMGATKVAEQFEEDIYFQHPTVDFTETDQALRIRKVDGRYTVTFKGPKLRGISKTREEINVNIDDGENMKQIFVRLGFREFATVKKKRKIYSLDSIKISLDEVEDIGDYAEFEKIINNENLVDDEERKIFTLINQLGYSTNDSENRSYLELILEHNNKRQPAT